MTHLIICSSASIPFTEQTIVPRSTPVWAGVISPQLDVRHQPVFDHDLSRYHSRAGLGAEYWRDYLKLSSNAYIGLTGWRSAPELIMTTKPARPTAGIYARKAGYQPGHNWVENWSMNNTMVMKWRCLTRMIAKVIPMLLPRASTIPLPASDSQCGTASGNKVKMTHVLPLI